ncbi:hypothetical protein CEXT_254851 [Caerostris extrusa]|uniref:Uncharacterized protein n=1 Tax=Caerostris extrusa TaxID=172846 RepID=A0AAV4XAF0_CAEEX|nr:hypothetical protein CEXT_254851 [Caerostris extrusa]
MSQVRFLPTGTPSRTTPSRVLHVLTTGHCGFVYKSLPAGDSSYKSLPAADSSYKSLPAADSSYQILACSGFVLQIPCLQRIRLTNHLPAADSSYKSLPAADSSYKSCL